MTSTGLGLTIALEAIDIHPVTGIQITVPNLNAKKSGSDPTFAPYSVRMVDGSPQKFYTVPASSDRGKLRRMAIRVMALHTTSLTSSFDAINQNYVGGAKSSEKDKVIPTAALAMARMRNPIIFLYGAGDPAFMPGSVSVGSITSTIPIGDRERDFRRGVRTDPFRRGDANDEMLNDSERERRITGISLIAERAPYSKAKKQIEKIEKTHRKAADKHERAEQIAKVLAGLSDDLAALAEPKPAISTVEQLDGEIARINRALVAIGFSDVSVQLPLAGYEVIPEGEPMTQTIEVRNTPEELIGLFVMSLQQFAADAFLGGKRSHGCGQIYRRYRVLVLNPATGIFEADGEITVEPRKEIVTTSPVLLRCRQAWIDADKSKYDLSYVNLRGAEIDEPSTGTEEAA